MSHADLAFNELLISRERPRASAPPPRHALRPARRAAWPLRRALVVLVFAASAGAAIYPTGAAWISDRAHAGELSGYVQSVAALPPTERTEMLEAARAYNAQLASGVIADPYSLGADGLPDERSADLERYLRALSVGAGGMMGRLRIDGIDVALPIFHGTGERSLSQGAGHLYGTSLPVGGLGTHSVLTSHSGLLNATLFTHLEDLEIGDRFEIAVLDETLVYEVDRIETVAPDETDALRASSSEDLVTLVTCTPTGINTHRLLVRGHRVDGPDAAAAGRTALAGDSADPGFPWWAVVYVGAVIAAIALSRLMVRRRPAPAPEPPPGPRRKGH